MMLATASVVALGSHAMSPLGTAQVLQVTVAAVGQPIAGSGLNPASRVPRSAPLRSLVDGSLRPTQVRLLGIANGVVSYFSLGDSPGSAKVRTVPTDEVVAIVIPAEGPKARARRSPLLVSEPNSPPSVRVVLTDGQRLLGRVVESTADLPRSDRTDDPSLIMEIPALGPGQIRVRLDQVVRLETLGDPLAEEASAASATRRTLDAEAANDDRVLLANGDVIRGFVESLGVQVVVRSRPDDPVTTYPLVLVDRVYLSNPESLPDGPCVWLSDGSMIALAHGAERSADFYSAPGRLGGALHAKPSEVVGVAFAAGRLVPLSGCKQAAYSASPDRAWTRAPSTPTEDVPLNAANIEIPGPMTVEWVVPPGATRFAGVAELVRSTERWGDCVMVLEDLPPAKSPRRLFEQRLSAGAPSARFDVALSPSGSGEHRLRMTLESGEHGAILDRVVLVRPLLLIGDQEPAEGD